MNSPVLSKIHRYPVKGFPGQSLGHAHLLCGRGIAHDREFAITNATTNQGEWMPARSFFINAVNDELLKFSLDFTGDENTITITHPDGAAISFKPDDPQSLVRANRQIAQFMASVGVAADMPSPEIVKRNGNGGFWDFTDSSISIINLNTLASIEQRTGNRIDPRRFRGNLLIEGLPAWEEFGLLGRKISIGDAELEIIRPALRCPATSVNPESGERDLTLPIALQEHFGHAFCGMYARVTRPGEIRPGFQIATHGASTMNHEAACNDRAPKYQLWPRQVKITACKIGKSQTEITLESTCKWPLPRAVAGQHIRFLLDAPGWTMEDVYSVSDHGQYQFCIQDSKTQDPLTAMLRHQLKPGQNLNISGPYGKGE